MCGTPEYAPPEVFLGRQYMGTPFDMWSTGVILYAMATGYFPFRTSSSGSIMHKEGFEIPDNCNAGEFLFSWPSIDIIRSRII